MISDSGTTATAALNLVRHGLAVFPIKPLAKTPATPNGFKDASKDPAVVEKMFSGEAAFNIGIATGKPSGTWVLDLDGPDGIAALDQLQAQHGTLPITVSALTGGGGKHLYFADNGTPIKNRTKVGGKSIDVRGSGGYVVSPPSIHKSGKPYQWEHSPDSTPFATAPDWLIEFVTTKDSSQSSPLNFTVGGGDLDLATAPGAAEGERHATALKLVGSAIGRGLDLCEVAKQAVAWARRCSPPMPDEDILRIVTDLSRSQATKPERVSDTETRRQPLKPPPPPWKPFPVNSLPEPLRKFVRQAAAAIGTDPAYVATALLPALAGAIGNSRQILLKRGWTEPALLWGVVVGDSGTQKSPAIDVATKYLRRRQATARANHVVEQERYDAELAAYTLAYDDWKRSGRKKGEPAPEEPPKPICTRFVCSDTTVEALAVLLADNPRGLLLHRDELAGWIKSFDQYKGGSGSDTAHWLTIYGARDLLVDRKGGTRPSLFVPRAAVSIVGGIQPGTLRRTLGQENVENGLAARLLLAMPPRRNKRWAETEIDEALDQEMTELFDKLIRLQGKEDDDGQLEPLTLGLTAGGKAAWVEFYNEHAERQGDATGAHAAALSKIEGAAARLALIIHLVRRVTDDKTPQGVDRESIAAGVVIARWYADEAERVYQILSEGNDETLRRQVVELISRRGGTITGNDLRRRSRHFADSDAAEKFLTTLVEAGLGSWGPMSTTDEGGRPTREFTLSNPVSVTETPKDTETAGVSDTDGQKTGESCQVTDTQAVSPIQAQESGENGGLVSGTPVEHGENGVSDTETESWEELTI